MPGFHFHPASGEGQQLVELFRQRAAVAVPARIDRPPAAAGNRKAPLSRLVSPMSPAVLSMRSVTPSGGGLHGRVGRRPPPLSLTPAPSLAVPLLDDDRRQLAAAPQALPRRRSRTLNNTPPGYFHAGV